MFFKQFFPFFVLLTLVLVKLRRLDIQSLREISYEIIIWQGRTISLKLHMNSCYVDLIYIVESALCLDYLFSLQSFPYREIITKQKDSVRECLFLVDSNLQFVGAWEHREFYIFMNRYLISLKITI